MARRRWEENNACQDATGSSELWLRDGQYVAQKECFIPARYHRRRRGARRDKLGWGCRGLGEDYCGTLLRLVFWRVAMKSSHPSCLLGTSGASRFTESIVKDRMASVEHCRDGYMCIDPDSGVQCMEMDALTYVSCGFLILCSANGH